MTELDRLEITMESWQAAGQAASDEIRNTQRSYLDWYRSALKLIPSDEVARFKDMYEGGTFMTRIKSFLNAPLQVNEMFASAPADFPVAKWRYPFDGLCKESLATQREILIETLHQTADVVKVLDELSFFFGRLPEFLAELQRSANPNVPHPTIAKEEDLQTLVHAMLKMLYADVRAEDPVPQHAGAGSRVDFLIQEAGVMVETKMTRKGLADRKLGEELLVDWGRYPRHPDCRGIFALVYDPDRRIRNAPGLISDLSRETGGVWTRVVVVR